MSVDLIMSPWEVREWIEIMRKMGREARSPLTRKACAAHIREGRRALREATK